MSSGLSIRIPGSEKCTAICIASRNLPFGSWAFIWQELWNYQGKTDDLRALGRKWLDEAPAEHRSWAHVWRAAWNDGNPDPAMRDHLATKALDWLSGGNLHNASWPIVWNLLWTESRVERDHLAKVADILLIQAPPKYSSPIRYRIQNQHSSAANVFPWQWKDDWEALWRVAGSDLAQRENLITQAKKWLSAFDLEQRGWTTVWKYLWDTFEGENAERENLVELAEKWLDLVDPSHPRWSSIWIALRNRPHSDFGVKNGEHEARGRKWLEDVPGKSWHLVWIELWSEAGWRDEAMKTIARKRLTNLEPKVRSKIVALLTAAER